MDSIRQPYWERIDPQELANSIDELAFYAWLNSALGLQELANSIDELPGEYDLYYLGRLVASGLMRELKTPDAWVLYARFTEGDTHYLLATQHGEDFVNLMLHCVPFTYSLVRWLPCVSAVDFAQLFYQYVHFISQQEPAVTSEGIVCQINSFWASE